MQKSTMWAQKIANFYCLLYQNLIHYHNKIFFTTAELNGLSSATYENSVICVHMVDFAGPVIIYDDY